MNRFRKRPRRLYVGGFDPLEAASDAWDGATDVVSSVWDRIPGSEYVDDATRAVVTGPLKDFANTGVGKFTLNVIAANASLVGGAIPLIGPAIIISTAAIPGLLRGDSFTNSLIEGWAWRIQTAAQILTPMVAAKFGEWTGQAGKALEDAAKKAFPDVDAGTAIKKLGENGISVERGVREGITQLKSKAPTIEDAESWAEKQAAKLGVPAAAVLQAYDLNSGTNWFQIERWDLASGKRKPEVLAEIRKKLEDARVTRLSLEVYAQPDPCAMYVKALQYNLLDVAAALKPECERFKADRDRLALLAQKNPCQAYVEAVKGKYTNWATMLKGKCEAFKTKTAMTMAEDASTKASINHALVGGGIILALGGAAWYLYKRGK